MLDTSDKRLRQRELLLRISSALTEQLDLGYVLNLVIDVAVDLLAGTSGLIGLRDEDGQVRVHAAARLPRETWSAFEPLLALPPTESYAVGRALGEIARTTALPLRQAIALPLVFRGNAIGIIYVFRAAVNVAFTREEQDLLTAFADQAAIAVTNARLYQGVLREKQHLDAIIEQSADGVMILDARWRITTFNRAMERLTGWSRDEAMGRPCAEVLGICTPQGVNICQVDCPLHRQPAPDDPVVEGWIGARDGRQRYVQSRYAVQRGAGGEFQSAIANVRDITRQRIEEEMQNTFISVVSHELKTPVSIIKGYAETLAREDAHWDAATMLDGLHVIAEESDRLAAQIQGLLDASRLQAGGMRLDPVDFALAPLAKDLVERFQVQAGEAFSFELRLAEDMPSVHADRERVRQILENLLSNAVKYSPDGGTIRLTARADGGYAVIAVSDQGVGIPPEEQPLVFRRFYRVDNRLRRSTPGTGLGLFLSKALAEAHGGRMWVESQPGRGSRFFFTLPLATPQLTDATPPEPPEVPFKPFGLLTHEE
ncbi:PAS domain-containing protein [Chloroflexia bacterium SDU3-3]|nr:PAS domain-containing protein [Chloroflexia bacterium SDU3-3]